MKRGFALVVLLGSSTPSLGGCETALPGPLECEKMAIQVLGRSAEDVEQSPAARRWVAHLVHGCLTTPFDREAVRCLEERRNLPHCMDELVRRAPEREEAARQLLTDRDRP